ncbi:tripartite tricarboxylate transporter permease [Mesorhizobium sp. CAU 1741]|uniref:tripartite tricarboxylate transporter permease n=1 Tax=Mesorhizobium sp. CAU 1741 TaxID=3140366 RepID=UPI00325ACC29
MDFFTNMALGLSVALSLHGIAYCFVGVTLGTFVGVLPGLGPMASIAMLLPLTYHVDPTYALIMLAGIYYGAAYGGRITSILLNLAGEASSAVTLLDGYPMARNGRAGVALFITAIASFVGGIIGIVLLATFSESLAAAALQFSAQEYFSLMLLGLVAAALLAGDTPFRSLAMVAFGLALGLVGIDLNSGTARFTFGVPALYDGLSLVAIAIGLFGLPEVMANAGVADEHRPAPEKITLRSLVPTRQDWKQAAAPILRGSAIGSFFGALPGTGGVTASFMSYAVEKRVAKDPSKFGKGAIEGVAAPEAANNSAVQTAFIPTLSLGIPGDPVMALMLGVMMVHNILPGPNFIAGQPELFWGLVASFLVGNIMLVVLNIPLISLWVRILHIPYRILFPIIVAVVCIGIYAVNYQVLDLVVLMLFGLLGYALKLMRFQAAPLLLGLVLGPMMEENFRRAMVIAGGDFSSFVTRPLSAIFLACIFALLAWTAFSSFRARRFAASNSANSS